MNAIGAGSLYQFPEGQIIAFALIFLRMLAFFIAAPIFGTNLVPIRVKILMSLIMGISVFGTLHFQNPDLLKIQDDVILFVAREIVVGLTMGFLMRMFFFAVSAAGEIASISMGLGSAQVFNPAMGSNSNVVEQFQLVLATLFFLAINGHHLFLSGLVQSFDLVPVTSASLNYEIYSGLAIAAKEVFVMGIKMAAPLMISVFLSNLAMGVLGRAVPQINVLVTSFPVTILLGLAVMVLSLPLMVLEMNGMLDVMATHFFQMMRGL